MKLNSKGWFARFYLFFEEKRLPDDFCSFFLGLVGRLVFTFVMGGSLLVGAIWGAVILTRFLWANGRVTLSILGAITLVALMAWLTNYKPNRKLEVWEEAKTILGGKVDSVKKRYCPRIDWS